MALKTYNDLAFAMAKRAKELSDMTMPMLRMGAGTSDTEGGRAQELLGMSKGDLVEITLTEEFVEEFDRDWEE